jgi:hypothetical protein
MQPRAAGMRTDTYMVRIFLNANAVAALPLQGQYTIILTACGQPITINVVHSTNT